MITLRTKIEVSGISGIEITEFLLNCTDGKYQHWWPGTHLSFHTRKRVPGDVGNLVFMDEFIGDRRVKVQGLVPEVHPGKRLVWQFRKLIRWPVKLILQLDEEDDAVRLTHTIEAGFKQGGRILDPLDCLLVQVQRYSMKLPSPTRFSLALMCATLIFCGWESTFKLFADVESLKPTARAEEKAAVERETGEAPPLANGEKQFKAYCAACHQRGGQGEEGRVPPLDDSPWVSGSEDRLIRIVLNGLRGPIEIRGETYNLEMPAFRLLFKDDDIASILSYVRQRYGAPSTPIKSETVSRVRKETQDRVGYWTVADLLLVP